LGNTFDVDSDNATIRIDNARSKLFHQSHGPTGGGIWFEVRSRLGRLYPVPAAKQNQRKHDTTQEQDGGGGFGYQGESHFRRAEQVFSGW
jgi:hypothetical protein